MSNRIPHLGATFIRIGVYLVSLVLSSYPSERVFLVRKSLSLPDPDVLFCKSLFYRRVIVIWIGIYLWGINLHSQNHNTQLHIDHLIFPTEIPNQYLRCSEYIVEFIS